MPQNSALAAYWNFFEQFNTRDPHSFASAMNYPHTRLSWAQQPDIFHDAEAFALSLDWQRFIETGWDHTIGTEPTLIHAGPRTAFIRGGWIRETKSGAAILRNHVTYIATQIDSIWGIQARFGIDAGNPSEAEPTEQSIRENLPQMQAPEIALDRCDAFARATGERDMQVLADICSFPLIWVERGSIRQKADASELPVINADRSGAEVLVHGGNRAATVFLPGNPATLIYLARDTGAGWIIRGCACASN